MTGFQKLRLPAAWALCILSVAVMTAVLLLSGGEEAPRAFIPPPFEENAVSGLPEVPEELGWGELDAKVYQTWVCGAINIKSGKADVWFTNPQGSGVWLKLRILDAQDNVLGETGLLRPGEYVQSVVLTQIPDEAAPIRLKVMGYEPETYYSAGSVVLVTTVAGRED